MHILQKKIKLFFIRMKSPIILDNKKGIETVASTLNTQEFETFPGCIQCPHVSMSGNKCNILSKMAI
jgi:hypothetical protein